MGAIYIGISGWRYAPWRGVFYPPGLAQARELDYASRFLPSIEINGSFYALQRPASYAAWYDATPPGFVFAVKGNRFLTHMLKLRGVETPRAYVRASGGVARRDKLGPFLWQFPPQLRFDAVMIDSASIVSDVMYRHVTHGGGCKAHTFGLHTPGVFLESYPVQVLAALSHDADNDNCRALVRPVLRFDLADLRKAYLKAYKQPGPMILQIQAPGEGGVTTSVRYEVK